MFIEIKDSSVGSMSADISLPVRPEFNTAQVTRVKQTAEVQIIAGLAEFPNKTQDLIALWLSAELAPGKNTVLLGTGLTRIENQGFPQLYGLTGTVDIEFLESEHIVGTFDLKGSHLNFTVKGRFDVEGVSPARNYDSSED
jgi:hypothetical protein